MLTEAVVHSALQKQPYISPFIERLNKATLEVLLIHFASNWNNFLKHCICADFLLTISLVESAQRKELSIAPFVERINTATLGKS